MSVNFAKHLPPSLDVPRVLVLDSASAANLPTDLNLTFPQGDDTPSGPFDAILGTNPKPSLLELYQLLRPGGRLILASLDKDPQSQLNNLNESGFIHCLVETEEGVTLYRGERPPLGTPIERTEALVSTVPSLQSELKNLKYVFLLVAQTPNKPAWRLAEGEKITWQAATLLGEQNETPILLAFTSLVRAVKFMQPAVLAQKFKGINKVGKFPSAIAQTWQLPLRLNPEFDDLRDATPGPRWEVDPQIAITGEE
jgi:hypothetical protein